LDRFLLVLQRHPARWVVRVCGDSPLFDPGHLDRCLALAEKEQADVVKFKTDPGTLLQGGEVVSARALQLSRELAGSDPLATEHVTAWALRHAEEYPDLLRTAYIEPEPGLVLQRKLSVDTAQDLARLRALYAELWDGKDILDLTAAAAWLRGPGAKAWEEGAP
jgi:spore coat polysaccharide biosynthesis protein SpsF (cytidylyltransferase family)